MTACNSCDTATLNICVLTNEDFVRQFQVRSRSEVIDLTGWTIEMQIRDGFEGSALVSVDSASTTGNGSTIDLLDAETGFFEVRIKQADLAALTIPANTRRKVFRYDIRFTDTVPISAVFVEGEFVRQRGVTV
jgi:hypothetical protein